jgi:hypothetical protein
LLKNLPNNIDITRSTSSGNASKSIRSIDRRQINSIKPNASSWKRQLTLDFTVAIKGCEALAQRHTALGV